jgi:hypothetical protein
LTKTKILMRDERQTRIFDLSGVESFEIDRARAESWLQTAGRWFVPVLFPILLIGSFIFRTLQVLVYAAVGILFTKMLNTNLGYKTLMRLAAVALTPVMLLNLLLDFLPFDIPVWWLLGTVIGLGYLFFAVNANSAPAAASYEPPTPPPSPYAAS